MIRRKDKRGVRLEEQSVLERVREPVKLTDVHGQVTDRWEEDFDVRASDEFRVHSSSILEQSPSEKTLGTVKLIKTKTKIRTYVY